MTSDSPNLRALQHHTTTVDDAWSLPLRSVNSFGRNRLSLHQTPIVPTRDHALSQRLLRPPRGHAWKHFTVTLVGAAVGGNL